MDFLVSAATDIGLTKTVNQDSYDVRVYRTGMGKVVFAVICDGMGGLSGGEIASASVVCAFCRWADMRLPLLCGSGIRDDTVRSDWMDIVSSCNENIKTYAGVYGTRMGTTVTALLITPVRYYILNVGDTRVYEIGDRVRKLTRDQTVTAREIELGNMTEAEAERDSRRSVLLQCVGASREVYPDMFFGDTKDNAVYMLCSDGFRHEITEEEIQRYLNPGVMTDPGGMGRNMEHLISLNKQRGERDNISAVSIRTFYGEGTEQRCVSAETERLYPQYGESAPTDRLYPEWEPLQFALEAELAFAESSKIIE